MFAHFVDRLDGEWFTECEADGTVRDATKTNDSKAAFHNVQCCLSRRHLNRAELAIRLGSSAEEGA